MLGYRYSESQHMDLDAYDLQGHVLFASTSTQAGERVQLRLDALVSDLHLAHDRYRRAWTLRPNLLYSFGPTRGVSRLFVELESSAYHDDPLIGSLERDARTFTVGFEHSAPIPDTAGSLLQLGTRLSRHDTEADRSSDLLGFDGAHDHRRAATHARLALPLRRGWRADGRLGFDYSRYLNRNSIDALFESGVAGARRRLDRTWNASLTLSRPLTAHSRLELRWTGTRQRSNLATYSYDRSIVGLYLRAETDG